MAKPETVQQLLRSLGLSVTLAAGAVPACVESATENPPWYPPDGGNDMQPDRPVIRDMLIDNPPWVPPDADAGDVGDAKEVAYEVSPAPDNPPWVPDVPEAGPDLPTDKIVVSENPPWVPPDAGDAKQD